MSTATFRDSLRERHLGGTVLYESVGTRVTAAAGVVRKEALGQGALERTRHEVRILRRLAGVHGVVQLTADCGPDEIVTEDVGGRTLASFVHGPDPADIDHAGRLRLALDLAHILAAVHRAGVVHSDLSPANILVSAEPGTGRPLPTLIDFHLSSTFVQGVPGFSHHRRIVGTLPYLAPEQTGRVGTVVDQRADLYALGATLYELCTGEPPFPLTDTLSMVHNTLTRRPVPPQERLPELFPAFAEMIMKLLAKEPDQRYQSADGLAHDLSRLCHPATPKDRPFPLGLRDFPEVLRPPTRLVGRDGEIETLRAAFTASLTGAGAGAALVSGAPGVGKSALINQLRSTVAACGGWFVTGKFDQYRQDLGSSALVQAVRALGRLLLAGGEREVADARARIVDAVGPNLPLLLVLPEYAALLDRPQTDLGQVAVGEGVELTARQAQTLVDLLRVVASPEQPLVMMIDDIQWAGHTITGLVDAVLRADDRLHGVFLVAAYRHGDIDTTHPLAAAIERWQGQTPPVSRIHLDNLPEPDLGGLLAEMLRLPASDAASLATVIGERTGGNPFDTVELLNALRRDGGLVLGRDGWSWDAGTIRAFVGDGDVVDLLTERIDRLPAPAPELLEMLACLGGEVSTEVLGTAAGCDSSTVRAQLLPALEAGLLVAGGDSAPAVRFRHDRVQQAAHRRSDPRRRRDLNLAMARRLAPASEAAEQYLQVVEADDVDGPATVLDDDETVRVAQLFVQVAPSRRTVDLGMTERLVGAALRLLDAAPAGEAVEQLRPVAERLWHAVMYDRGRFDEADTAYGRMLDRTDDPVELAVPASLQVASLTSRDRAAEAVELGLGMLRGLGLDVPDADFGPDVEAMFAEIRGWAEAPDVSADLRRSEPTDPRVLAIGCLVNELIPPSFFVNPLISAWVVLTACRQWREHGPFPAQVSNVGGMAMVGILVGNDYRIAYQLSKHALMVGEVRGYEPQAPYLRHMISMAALHWFEPLENTVDLSRRSREGLIQGGELQDAAYTYLHSTIADLDCAPSLETGLALVDTAIDYSRQVGHDQMVDFALGFRQFVRALRGDTRAPGSFDDDEFAESAYVAGLAGKPMRAALFRIYRALSAALCDDSAALVEHASAIEPLLPYVTSTYPFALGQLLRGLALARRLPELTGAERDAALAGLSGCRGWLADRAADAPANFAHLVGLLDAERAWAEGDRWAALAAFDQARRLADATPRPWHQALIIERSALFHLENGLPESGGVLLAEARRRYAAWCAHGKVRQLDAEHPLVATPPRRRRSTHGSSSTSSTPSEAVDMMAVLRSSQALGSETGLPGLRIRIGEVLGAMTGATSAQLALRTDTDGRWQVWDTTGADPTSVLIDDSGHLLPLSAFRYAERTGAPLVIHDNTDERFAADPYLLDRTHCSLLLVPLMGQGVLRGMLVLENSDRIGAFTDRGLDAVQMVSGQLVASLDNAQLYASLERKVADRTRPLQEANSRLEVLSLTDALTGLPNRRRFDMLLETEFEHARRQGRPLGLAMADVDHFKAFNDHYGHPAGDECLRVVAQALRGSLRQATDTVCRYGGEEFALIFPVAEESGVRHAAERARAAVEAMAHPHTRSSRGIVTITMGVACTQPGDHPELLVARADAGLYAAKENGRNQVGPLC